MSMTGFPNFGPILFLSAAIGLAAGTAQADGPASRFEILLGGDAYTEAAFVSQNHGSGLRTSEFSNRLRLMVTPIAKADNGLEYGGRLFLQAAGGSAAGVVWAYGFVNGGFGTIHAGAVNGPDDMDLIGMQTPMDWRVQALTNAPVAYINSGATGGVTDLPYFKSGFDWPTFGPLEGAGTKLSYYSPRFAGFQATLSYEPRNDSANTDVNRVKRSAATGNSTASYQDLVEASLNYSQVFGDVKVTGFGAVLVGQATETATTRYRDLTAWHLGGRIAVGPFAVGALMMDTGKSGIAKTAGIQAEGTRMVSAGVQYTIGATILGAQYQRGEDAGNLAVAGKRSLALYTAGAQYHIAPGLQVGGEYSHFTAKSDSAGRSDEGSVVLLRTALAF